jgi:sugar O-acyltransferase (sialic acid O-acetyltransferase NeuD family)
MSRMSRLVVACAGGFGREVAAYARDAGFDVDGFLHDLDAYPGSLDGVELGAPVLGRTDEYQPRDGELIAIGLGDIAPRRALAEELIARGARLATVVHPTAWVAPSAGLGEGVVIGPFAFVGPDTIVGDLSILNTYASIGHDTVVGSCCVLAPYAVANGRVTLEDDVFLATHATVTPRRRVGAGTAVSAGSVVFQDVPAGSLVSGNPARPRGLPPTPGRSAQPLRVAAESPAKASLEPNPPAR